MWRTVKPDSKKDACAAQHYASEVERALEASIKYLPVTFVILQSVWKATPLLTTRASKGISMESSLCETMHMYKKWTFGKWSLKIQVLRSWHLRMGVMLKVHEHIFSMKQTWMGRLANPVKPHLNTPSYTQVKTFLLKIASEDNYLGQMQYEGHVTCSQTSTSHREDKGSLLVSTWSPSLVFSDQDIKLSCTVWKIHHSQSHASHEAVVFLRLGYQLH